MRRRVAGAFYVVLVIAFVYAGAELLVHFEKTLLCWLTIVGSALGTIRAARLAFDTFAESAERRIPST